jgi:hypothetical protein
VRAAEGTALKIAKMPVLLLSVLICAPLSAQKPPWPPFTSISRPWTRWWWLGSAVDPAGVEKAMRGMQAAGFGGVEICPIYGAKGAERHYRSYLSSEWLGALSATTSTAARMGLQVDFTTGTGWPFGGPWIGPEQASARLELKTVNADGPREIRITLPAGRATAAAAFGDNRRIDLTQYITGGDLKWSAPAGRWTVVAALQTSPVQRVKRAAPGGEGSVVDPYSVSALQRYLARFDEALGRGKWQGIRAQFHDSFEYYGATGTPNLFEEFQKRRGYSLALSLDSLAGIGDTDAAARVKSDYRLTMAELHLEWLRHWTEWCRSHGSMSRNQAHGGPGNLLDAYGAVDIPETEIFKEPGEDLQPMLRFASSAAHTHGRTLASAEAFTWLGEHFSVALKDLKPAADLLFLSGINHLIYHGTPYSPDSAAWPGWLFYASVNFGPNGGLWPHLSAFNAYITRCQSVLQQGYPDNDLLVYFPIWDIWHNPNDLLMTFPVPGKWMFGTLFYETARELTRRNIGYDFASDADLARALAGPHEVRLGHGRYRVLLIPGAHRMPPETLREIDRLVRGGAVVRFVEELPADVPGMHMHHERRNQLMHILESWKLTAVGQSSVVGLGTVGQYANLDAALDRTGVAALPNAAGIRYISRRRDDGFDYFIVNTGTTPYSGGLSLPRAVGPAAVLDPMTGEAGTIKASRSGESVSVWVQLEPGMSLILRTGGEIVQGLRPWRWKAADGRPTELLGDWKVEFLEGGAVLPKTTFRRQLSSWTGWGSPELQSFCGTARYSLTFDRPKGIGASAVLDLGDVRESARVLLNGKEMGTVWTSPFRVWAQGLKPKANLLQIEVANLAANRIAEMDRRKAEWKIFHEINFVNRDYKPFDASQWPMRPGGLLGPVKLIPIN